MDDELKSMMKMLIDRLDQERAVNAQERAVNAQERAVNAEFRATVLARLDGIDKRLDDQSRTITALIPVRIAAVGRDEERRPT